MGNVCSIFYDRFNILKKLTNCPKKALILDQFIFWWQNSKYKLKNSNHIWFMRPYENISQITGIGLSTLKKYIKEFSDLGLIERRSTFCAMNKTNNPDEFEVKKRTYIRITEKLLVLLQQKPNQEKNNPNNEMNNINSTSPYLKQKETTEKSKMKPSIYKDQQYNSINNIINKNNTVNFEENVSKKNQENTKKQFKYEKELEGLITEEVKNIIKGMLFNIQYKHHILISDPEQVFAEVVFSVIDPYQFNYCENIKHKINSISFLLRNKKWKTPKGFYNHSYIGHLFKERKEVKENKIKEAKLERELLGIKDPKKITEIKSRMKITYENEEYFNNSLPANSNASSYTSFKQDLLNKLKIINHEIHSEGSYLQRMELDFKAGLTYASKELIENSAMKIARLYEEQAEIERKLANNLLNSDLCA